MIVIVQFVVFDILALDSDAVHVDAFRQSSVDNRSRCLSCARTSFAFIMIGRIVYQIAMIDVATIEYAHRRCIDAIVIPMSCLVTPIILACMLIIDRHRYVVVVDVAAECDVSRT